MKSVGLAVAVAAAVGLWGLTSSTYTVDEGQQALLVRLGKPMGVDTEPGLKFKLPLVDTVIRYDTRLLPLEPPAEKIILGDQKRIEVETYTRYRIRDPLLYYQTVATPEQAHSQLTQLVSSALRRKLGQIALPRLLSPERNAIIEDIRAEVATKAEPLGLDVVDVRIRRADLPIETSQAIYDRMKSEREREAKELRAQGFEWAQQIKARADRERAVLLSEVDRDSRIVRGQADAEANRLFAEAFKKDVDFYRLYRTLQTYRKSLAEAGPTLILTPDAEFLRTLRAGPTYAVTPDTGGP